MFTIEVDNVAYTTHGVSPFKWSGLLDERLDEARVSLKSVSKDLFAPLTPVKITVAIGSAPSQELDYVIASDESQEVPPGSGLFDHELTLIEPTKLLERVTCETLTFQNSLGRTYTSNQVKADPIYE